MSSRLILPLATAALLFAISGLRADEPPVDFARQIRPILSNNCFACHGPDSGHREAGLRLDQRDAAMAELDSGARAVVPSDPPASELVRRIEVAADSGERMPPPETGKQLSADEIALLKRWIKQGAPWEEHWAFVPPKRPTIPPADEHTGWARGAIDRFILAGQRRKQLSPSPSADKAALLRRVTFDLTGLPPTLAELDAFLADDSPDAFERVVDRLLASPAYGEHQARFWLDAARYSDTNGYQGDRTRTMWPWRDWVVAAFNENMPIDQFTVEQLAGDLLPEATDRQKLASGFHRNMPLNGEGGRIAEESRVEYVFDRVETTGTVWLGLTIGCARCHDHKYDPLAQQEYYDLYAYFNNVAETGRVDAGGNAKPVLKIATPLQQRKAERLRAQIAAAADEAKPALEAQLAELAKQHPEVMVMQDQPQPRQAFVLQVGAYDEPDKSRPASPGVPACLPLLPEEAPKNRLALARWLVRRDHPLTARVWVNRTWQQLFGRGLVETSEDFGAQGTVPTHPDLLDRLAVELIESGWDQKQLVRAIVTSAAYRQSSRVTPESRRLDPDNKWLARGPRFRLASQTIRDAALAVSGLLVDRVGGPPVKPYQPAGPWAEFSLGKIKYQQDHGEKLYRRSLYTFWRRSVAPTMFFDSSARQVCSVKPSRTNTPLHALTTLNDTAFVEAARALAERAVREIDGDPRTRIAHAFRLTTSRPATERELDLLTARYERLATAYREEPEAAKKLLSVGESARDASIDAAEHAALTAVMTVILNLDETLTKG